MYKKEHVVHLLQKIKQTLERIIANSKEIDSYQYYYLTPAGMERLESTCMLLIAVGESTESNERGNRVNPLLNSLAKMSASDTGNSLIAYTAFSSHRTKKNGL